MSSLEGVKLLALAVNGIPVWAAVFVARCDRGVVQLLASQVSAEKQGSLRCVGEENMRRHSYLSLTGHG